MICTTLNKIREHAPCQSGWRKLLAGLNKAEPDDELLPLVRILEINGLNDALWALRATDCDRESRLLAVAYARQVQHLMTDERSIACIDVAERFANGKATRKELIEARVAAEAAYAAVNAANAAARAAELAAANAAARAANAAEFAAGSAAYAAGSAAYAAVNAANAAAYAAGSAAPDTAEWVAAYSDKLAAAYAAGIAEWAAMREKQAEIFREIFG